MSHEYTCDICKGTFTSGWSKEEASAESEKEFGVEVTEETHGEVCDDCYKKFMAWYKNNY